MGIVEDMREVQQAIDPVYAATLASAQAERAAGVNTATLVASLARESRSSITLTRNAKGDYQWEIKIYYEDGEDGFAEEALRKLDTKLRRAFLP